MLGLGRIDEALNAPHHPFRKDAILTRSTFG
jgi:hypothetical protein